MRTLEWILWLPRIVIFFAMMTVIVPLFAILMFLAWLNNEDPKVMYYVKEFGNLTLYILLNKWERRNYA